MIPNLKQITSTSAQNIWRGGQPENDADWQQLRDLGITAVVKLDTGEDAGAADLGLTVTALPIDWIEQVLTEPSKASMVLAATALRNGNVFVHCEHGEDRTGLVVGCYRVWSDHWSKDAAWEEMLSNGFHEILLGLTMFWRSQV